MTKNLFKRKQFLKILNKNREWLLPFFAIFFCVRCEPEQNKINDWRLYKADEESSGYSELKQVNKQNVSQLKIAWTFSPNDAPDSSRHWRSECNPIIIDGVMYATSARHRVYAINAGNGQQIWSFDPFNGGEGGGVNRGVTYWEEGSDKRILFTAGDNLYAVNAVTGKPIATFGVEGKVSMNVGMRNAADKISVRPTSPGIVYNNLLILGTEVSELYGGQPGYERAYDIRTGKLVWTFHTIPLPGETGYETWPKDAWKYAGGANDWSGMSLDKKRGIVFLALGSPSYDSYGADRLGKNLFGNCIVALEAKSGKLIWYFQTIHHDLWDYDLPAPPNLVTVEKDGKKIDAVAQVSKVGFIYVLNRETGESLFPIEERKVPVSDVPGEEAWPTQPFPLKPLPFSRQFMSKDDLFDFSAASHDSLLKRFNELRYEGLFTPPSTRGTLCFPATTGGSEWGGAAYDRSTGVLYVKSNESPEIALLQKMEPVKVSSSLMVRGKIFYQTYCSGCHGSDRKGIQPEYPSLIGLRDRMNEAAILQRIEQGSGKMPAFASVLKGQEKAIISYLFQIKNNDLTDEENNLIEIHQNEIARENVSAQSGTIDSADKYLNVTAYNQFRGPDGHPAVKPPWGTLNAINLNTGEYEWKIPVGNYPELQKPGADITGGQSSPGPIVTKGGLVFFGGTRDKKFFAFDKNTGKLLWEITLPGTVTGSPCTYMVNGKQFIAVSVAGDKQNSGGYIIAFALPGKK